MAGLRWQRVAELVANELRSRILTGDLEDGASLPKEDDLREEYPVSKPSLREAMRILEAEGLITVRRGNVGGAVVHRPSASNVAYTMALVLASKQTGITDVARALIEVEPGCAALCAERRDRARAVVPKLRALQKEAMANVHDLVLASTLSREFHEALVQLCGNESLIMVVGALEGMWSSHETAWALRAGGAETVPVDERRSALEVHGEMIGLISAGDSEGVRALSLRHLQRVQSYPSTAGGRDSIDPVRLRDRLPG